MASDLHSDIEDVLKRHVGVPLEQDVGPLLGMVATIAREVAHAEATTALYEQAVRAALTDQPPDYHPQVSWHRTIRRAAEDTPSTRDRWLPEDQMPRRHSSSAW